MCIKIIDIRVIRNNPKPKLTKDQMRNLLVVAKAYSLGIIEIDPSVSMADFFASNHTDMLVDRLIPLIVIQEGPSVKHTI